MALVRRVPWLSGRVRAQTPRLKRLSRSARSRHLLVLDVVGLTLAVIIALAVWRNVVPDTAVMGAYLWLVGIIVATRVAVDILLGLYTHAWRYASVGDMGAILACVGLGTLAAAVIANVLVALGADVARPLPSLSFWTLEAALALAVLATPRFLIRAATDLSETTENPGKQERTLLYGAGWAGVMMARSAERSPDTDIVPVGFLDDNPGLRGRRVNGLRVYGDISDLARARRKTGATSLLITMPRATGESVRHVVDAAMAAGLKVRTVPPVTDLLDGTLDATRIRKVRVEDLLRRPPARDHSPELHELLRGRTVMVTGAAGSIGSELVRQLIALEPAHVAMVDQAESAMYMCAQDLQTRRQVQEGTTTIGTHLIDVTDREAMTQLMRATKPVVVFHAAAYKHVPLLERHVAQAVRANIVGTMSVVQAAIESGVERFVLVSTDKAVRPSSVMGATKRVAEMIVADAARRTGLAYVAVRFGNVLGSNGSVIPVFQSQLENGQPLTITHEDMTRYFMTIPEASWLILDATALAESRSLYVLDMGEPVKIIDVARDLARLAGRDPDTVPIKVVGLRPGEKLHEELFYDEEQVQPTEVPKVLVTESPAPPETLAQDLDRLLEMAASGQDQALRVSLLDYVGGAKQLDEAQPMTMGFESAEVPDDGFRPVIAVPVHANGSGNGERAATTIAANGSGPANGEPANGLLEKRTVITAPREAQDQTDEQEAAGVGTGRADAPQR